MRMALKILNGPLKARFARIRAGQKIGRFGTDLNLPDAKVSQEHVIIEENATGQLFLKDLDSSNGILYLGQRRDSLVLTPGILLQLGSTQLEVGLCSEDGKSFVSTTSQPPEVPVEPKTWGEFFVEYCADKAKVKNRPQELTAFPKFLELEFLRGPLIQKTITLAYGPRTLGAQSVDFPLYSDNIPDDLMSFMSKDDEIVMKTRHPSLLKLNDKSVITANLKDGDILDFSEHRVRIHLKSKDD